MSENKASGGNAFSSLMGFLMTATGFAVGVGSIWRFPYLMGTNGGALFLIVYVLIIVVIGIPLLTAETAMGFKTQKTAVLAYRALAPQHKIWSYAGYAHLLAALLIVSYTIPIYAWILGYLYNTAIGTFHVWIWHSWALSLGNCPVTIRWWPSLPPSIWPLPCWWSAAAWPRAWRP